MATYIISGVSAAQCATNSFTVISSTAGVTGGFGAINPNYKTGAYTGVDFVIAYRTTDPTAAQAAFTATGSVGGIYMAQRVPLGSSTQYTVCFPQYSSAQGSATTQNRIMAYTFSSDNGTAFDNNDYLSADIQGYTPIPRTVTEFVAAMRAIGIPTFDNSGALVG